jgi:hypothetical protein
VQFLKRESTPKRKNESDQKWDADSFSMRMSLAKRTSRIAWINFGHGGFFFSPHGAAMWTA